MTETRRERAVDRWKRAPALFIETVLHDPETGKPFVLLPAEKAFLAHAFKIDADGRLLYPEQVFAAPKKSGKTGFAALMTLTMLLLFGGMYGEGYCCANDEEQAASRVFQAIRRIVERSPLLKPVAKITQDRIVFPTFHETSIMTLANSYSGAAGANPVISTFDELWGYTSEASRRMWDEMVPPPTRQFACRLTVTYGGFSGESALLEELHKRGMALPEVAPNLRAGDGLLMFWSHEPIAPWQTDRWLAEMRRSLRPNQYLRMIENRFVTSESSFVDMAKWDECVDPGLAPILADKELPAYVGVDASVKHDSTAIVAVSPLPDGRLRLAMHRVFQPTPEEPLDFEQAIEATLIEMCQRFAVRRILFDPYQMQATAQRLQKQGLPIREFPQSVPNLTLASQGLYELIESRGLVLYPDAGMRLAASRAVAIESARGWRIAKEKQSHKIDVIVALGMAAWAALDAARFEQVIPMGSPIISGQPDPYTEKAAPRDSTAAYYDWMNGGGGGDFYEIGGRTRREVF